MDGPKPALRLLNHGAQVRLVGQSMVRTNSRYGAGAERATLYCPAGRSAKLGYPLIDAPVVPELRFTAIVMCNRPGLRLAALVALPRSIDPATGRPFELLLLGMQASRGTGWEKLTLSDMPGEARRVARVRQAQHGVAVDVREAVVKQLVLLTPGGSGATELLVDQIEMYGPLPRRKAAPANHPLAVRPRVQTPPMQPDNAAPNIPRVLQWQGESFELVRQMGFDAVALPRGPTAEQLADARRSQLQLVCPPPSSPDGASDYAVVIAWDLGALASDAELRYAGDLRDLFKRNRLLPDRPALAWPMENVRSGSRTADILVLDRPLAGAALTQAEYAAWLNRQLRLARPGTRFWVALDTHLDLQQSAQLAALRGAQAPLSPASLSDLAAWTSTALSIQPRGFIFKSDVSLAGDDAANRRRAIAAELTNMRLELIEPWLLSGKPAVAATTSRGDMSALVLKTERSHLLAPITASQLAISENDKPVTFLIAGAAESAEAYLLTLGGSERLRSQRVTGGVQVTADRLPFDGLILSTEDGVAFSQVERRLRQHADRAAKLYGDLAKLELASARSALGKLPADLRDSIAIDASLERIESRYLRATSTPRRIGRSNESMAAQNCLTDLKKLERQIASSILGDVPRGVWPVAPAWTSLPDLAQVVRQVEQSTVAGIEAPGGDFEDLAELVHAGWRHLQHPVEGVATSVRLSPEAPYRGALCLQLEARSTAAEHPAATASSPPVWITSPPLPTDGGPIIEVSGRVRSLEPLSGVPGELLIFDSVGGEQSALRIRHAPVWQPFRIVRAVPQGMPMQMTIALSGVGSAEIDSVEYRAIPYTAAPSSLGHGEAARSLQR